jgi:serine protease DegQ
MSPPTRTLTFLVQCIVVGLAAAFVVSQLLPGLAERARQRWGAGATPDAGITATAAGAGPFSYATAVERAAPSVVSIYVNKLISGRQILFDATTRRFSGLTEGPVRQQLQRAEGSGVLVSSDGYILTNHHVVSGADEIQTVLWDGRVTRARIVGTDSETDLAVLKIEGSNLPAMSLENGRSLRVGDVVLAIGNPFGLSQSVTQGIVSGLGRTQLNRANYVDFIQTDAAVNVGNSGGALVDANGELIGINASVLSGRLAASVEGIGFAIPIATARAVFDQIVDHGLVVRGWLGAEYGDAPVLPGGLPQGAPRGVALTLVHNGGPADVAGLMPGDVLLQFDGEPIVDQSDLRDREAALAPGTRVTIAGLRAGVPFTTQMALTQRPQPRSA